MIRAGDTKSATALRSALLAGSIREFIGGFGEAKAAPKLDLGGLVAGDFHADADFDNHGSRPGHFFLRIRTLYGSACLCGASPAGLSSAQHLT
jgi:hypothetical protein